MADCAPRHVQTADGALRGARQRAGRIRDALGGARVEAAAAREQHERRRDEGGPRAARLGRQRAAGGAAVDETLVEERREHPARKEARAPAQPQPAAVPPHDGRHD
eukprot:2429941-Prymnesium_polylepis.2